MQRPWAWDVHFCVGTEVFWSVVFCLFLLCSTGVVFAVEMPFPEGVRWAFVVLFCALFLAASLNQGFVWNAWARAHGASPENWRLAWFMYADRALALAILILGATQWSVLQLGDVQWALLVAAVCFYIGTFLAYFDPPLLHPTRCWLLGDEDRWYCLLTNLWHLTIVAFLASILGTNT